MSDRPTRATRPTRFNDEKIARLYRDRMPPDAELARLYREGKRRR